MSLFSGPQEHAENPPDTWQVVNVAKGLWHLTTKDGGVLGYSYRTKKSAEADKVSGPYVNLYRQETRWYAGENVTGWRPYSECVK